MKTDARVKYTKMVLKKALLELMQHKPVNKITVKEICERAELNRATFYAHYSDCFDLLESIEEELFGQFERSMQSYTRSFDIAGLVDGLYRIVQENEAVCRVLLFGRRSTELIHRMIAYAGYTTQVKAPVAQLDRASDCGSEGLGFESLRACHLHHCQQIK